MHGKFWMLSSGKASSHGTALPSFVWVFSCVQFSCFRNPPNSDMDYRILNVRTFFLCVRIRTGVGHNILTRKNSYKFVLCSGRDSNLWSRNALDLEADALPTEPPRKTDIVNNPVVCHQQVVQVGLQDLRHGQCRHTERLTSSTVR